MSFSKNDTKIFYFDNATIIQKPRSFSLSGDSLRSNLTSQGSETRLDDMIKSNHVRYSSHKVGIGRIGQCNG